jgi:toxin HigB-1
VIVSFRHKGLEALYRRDSKAGIEANHEAKLRRVLSALDVSRSPADLQIPGFRIHQLHGRRKGYWSIWISGNWRVIFRFIGEDIELVDYLDYH